MSLLIKGKDDLAYSSLQPMSYSNEDELRNIFIQSIESIFPVIDSLDAKTFYPGMEFENIDVFLVGDDGSLFIVETKLAQNSDARMVVAQILEYRGNLDSYDFDDFINKWQERYKQDLSKILNAGAFSNLKNNWKERNFNLVIVMDSINQKIEKIGEILRKNNFLIYGVVINKFIHNDKIILDYDLLWSDYIKESKTYKNEYLSDDVFIRNYSAIGFKKQILEFVDLYLKFNSNENSVVGVKLKRTPKNITFEALNGRWWVSLNGGPVNIEEAVFCISCEKGIETQVKDLLKPFQADLREPMKKEYGLVGYMSIKYYSSSNFIQLLKGLSSINN